MDGESRFSTGNGEAASSWPHFFHPAGFPMSHTTRSPFLPARSATSPHARACPCGWASGKIVPGNRPGPGLGSGIQRWSSLGGPDARCIAGRAGKQGCLLKNTNGGGTFSGCDWHCGLRMNNRPLLARRHFGTAQSYASLRLRSGKPRGLAPVKGKPTGSDGSMCLFFFPRFVPRTHYRPLPVGYPPFPFPPVSTTPHPATPKSTHTKPHPTPACAPHTPPPPPPPLPLHPPPSPPLIHLPPPQKTTTPPTTPRPVSARTSCPSDTLTPPPSLGLLPETYLLLLAPLGLFPRRCERCS